MSNSTSTEAKQNTNIVDLFVAGAYKGFNIAIKNMMPNVMLAFIIIQALKVTGLLDLIGVYAGPVMALWGLPGQAIAVILASLMSMGGAVGVAAGLLTAGILTPYRCNNYVAKYVSDGKSCAKRRPLPWYFRCQCCTLPCYHRYLCF